MKRTLIIFLTLIFSINVISQSNNEDEFPKHNMYEDFDEYLHIIQTYNSQISIRKLATNYDILSLIKSRRNEIDKIKSKYEFYEFMKEIHGYLIDMHAYMIKYNTVNTLSYLRSIGNVDTIQLRINIKEHLKYISKNSMPYCTFGNYLYYYNGDYYTLGKIGLYNKENHKIVLENCKLIKIGELNIDEYVRNNLQKHAGQFVRWDYLNKKYYISNAIFPKTILTFKDNLNENEFQIDMSEYSPCEFNNPDILKSKFYNEPTIHYFNKQKLLYIYIPRMVNGIQQVLTNEIKDKTKGKKLAKVVFDVRNNPGGSDWVWMNIVESLVSDTLNFPCKMVAKDSPLLIEAFQKEDSLITDFGHCEFLGETFRIISEDDILIPSSNNLKFKGQFYVLQNQATYSAAHSLSSICRYSEKFTSIGIPTGLLSGRGTGPFMYQLKNSLFTFTMESDLDITNATNAIDCYQDIPEVLLDLSLQESVRLEMNEVNTLESKSKKYLLKKDPYFRKVLDL